MKDIIYPAHYRKIDDRIQTVEEHLLGVGKLCSEYAKKHGFECTGKLLGILHDLGKYTSDFRNYITEGIHREKEGLKPQGSVVDHGKYGAIFIYKCYPQNSLFDKVIMEIMSMVICYHHGGLEDYITDDLDCKLFNRCKVVNQEDEKNYKEACDRLYERVLTEEEMNELFKRSSEEFRKFMQSEEKPDQFDLHILIKILYSCLIDADRYDTYLFMQKDSINEHLSDEAIAKLWDLFDKRLSDTENMLRSKKPQNELEIKIHNLRQDIWKQCNDFGDRPEGIYTLTVPTGGGKTLSSLRYAINHAKKYYKKSIIYVLPFTSIIEQNAAVVREALNAGDYLLEHHSNVIHEDFNNESEFDEKWEYNKLLTEQWTSPIIFTTMVQFLNSIFAGGTQSIRRLHNIRDSILIFDEIQALPITCISLFNKAINYLHRKCRNTIILCSATQPCLDRVEHKISVNGEIIKDLNEKFREFKRMEVKPEIKKGGMSIAELGEFIEIKKRDNSSMLIIMNTKSMAEKVFYEVKNRNRDDSTFFYFLSTNLCPAHRRKIIVEMKDKLAAGEHVVCVSTQLIEAGVDISFSCVIRHIAGLDSIAQAAGRGNRHGEGQVKNTYIVRLENESLGPLDTIKYGEEATKAVLDKFLYEPESFDYDLLSPKALSYYYENYYDLKKISGQMDFPISKGETTILEKLSNIKKTFEYFNRFGEKCPTILQYQFRTASMHFKVIEDNDTSVVVPYGDGKKLIQRMRDSSLHYPDRNLIREAQQYSVNISKSNFQKLKEKGAIELIANCGALILSERFYDEELGVIADGKNMELAMY